MNKLELTDEEIETAIKQAYNLDDELPEHPILIFGIVSMQRRAIAKAAQRKLLVELFDKRWRSYEENILEGTHRMTFAISDEEWQELRRGVGL